MRMKKTGILAGITAACICIAQTVPAFGAGQDLVGFVPNEEKQEETQVKSYLTGENVPESIGRRRPVAVMQQQCRSSPEWYRTCRCCLRSAGGR